MRAYLKCNLSRRDIKLAITCLHYTAHEKVTTLAELFRLTIRKKSCSIFAIFIVIKVFSICFCRLLLLSGIGKNIFCLLLWQKFSYKNKASLISSLIYFILSSTHGLVKEICQRADKSDLVSASRIIVVSAVYTCFTNFIFILNHFGKTWIKPPSRDRFVFEVAVAATNELNAVTCKYLMWVYHPSIHF